MLEMLSAKTRDGRYRYVAHKLMNYLFYQQSHYRENQILLGPESTEKLAVAYLLADVWNSQNIGPQVGRHWPRPENDRPRG